jgi:glycine/D-amino acid oxidase-like deaminating enzyme
MRNTSAEIELSKYGTHLYSELEKKGYSTSWKQCGSLSLSSTTERLTHLKRNLGRCRSFGIDAHIISPKEAQEKWPHMNTKDVNAALWLPNDGTAVSSDCTNAMAKLSKENGAKIFENTQVTKLIVKNNKIVGVRTPDGDVYADVVVVCGGLWTRYLIENTPLHPCYHMYIITEPANVSGDLPIMRDLDALIYVREWSGGLCIGGFEEKAKPCFVNEKAGVLKFHLFNEDWEQFDPLLQGALNRIDLLNEVGVRQFLNGPESFTSDNAYILGESPYIKNLFI